MQERLFRVKPENLDAVLAALAAAGIEAHECEPHTCLHGGFFGEDHYYNPAIGMAGIRTVGGTRRQIDAAFDAAIKRKE